jgi:hypothetical protein
MLFSKKIDTKRDHFVELKSALTDAINAALKAGVTPLAIERELKSHASEFERAERARIDRLKYGTVTRIATDAGIKEIDHHAQQVKAEAKRAARELREQQQAYRDAVNEQYEREKWTR